MWEGQKESQGGRTETLPRTVRRTVAEEVAAVADNGEARTPGRERSAADEYGCSLKSLESWSSVGRPGPPAGFYQI